jgi:serine/threonine-protein kinase
MDLSPGTRLAQYHIVSKIGEGGMGEVYLAQDTRLDRKVAIKFLHDEFSKDTDKLNRFILEAKAASALNHPNILTVYEIGDANGKHYLATELIDGQTLREQLSQKEALPLKVILKIGIQVAEALSSAHQAGIIHRDIKPENIMIRRDGYAKVLDFGLAKLTEPAVAAGWQTGSEDATRVHHTKPGVIMGTVSYMSPEQARGKPTDARTDIWSLGVVLYEMLARRVPFTGETINHTIVSILENEPLLLDNIPAELQRIVRKSMTKDLDMRYQSARDLLIDLKNLRRDLDIQGELERSIIPSREVPPVESSESAIPKDPSAATRNEPVAASEHMQSSSLEYAVTQVKRHKLAATVIAIVLLAAIISVGYFALGSKGSAKQIDSIAVMPFINQSKNPDVEYLSDGMTETLISSLSRVPNLSVKPRTTVFRYKGKDPDAKTIARELNVQAILNGRVEQHGDQLNLSLELIDAEKDIVLWSQQYNRKQSDIVQLQTEIAKDVSTKLRNRLTGADETTVTKAVAANPEAYQAYLKGRYYWNRRTAEDLRKAVEQFRTAADSDPNYALAYAGLADCYAIMPDYSGTPSSETAPQAKAFAQRAIAIDDQLAEPHATLGIINMQLFQWAEAEKEASRAVELNPNYPTGLQWYGSILLDFGKYEEAAAVIRRAYELDPLSGAISDALTNVYQVQNNYQACIDNSLKFIELDPTFAASYRNLGFAYLKVGRTTEAISAVEKAVVLSNRASWVLGDLGYTYAVAGKRTEALAIVKELEAKYAQKQAAGRYVAAVLAGLGDNKKAVEWLDKDLITKNGRLAEVRWTVPFESLQLDPEFVDFLRRTGLPGKQGR